MKFIYANGKNNKNYVYIDDVVTKDDMELYDYIKDKILTRKEYKPFMKSSNKYITASYLFNDFWFPYQFWTDVRVDLLAYTGKNYELIGKPDYVIVDEEIFEEWYKNLKVPEEINLEDEKYKFQPSTVVNAINEELGRAEIGTSGGKTFITYAYCKYLLDNIYSEYEDVKKILIIVPTQLLCKQLKEDFLFYDSKNDLFDQINVATIYAGHKNIIGAQVICGTYQSLCEYEEEFFDDFSVIICDELHRANAYSIRTKIYDKCKNAKFIFGMTGTYPDKNTLEYLHITAMFGPELQKVTTEELIKTGVSNEIEIDIIKIEYYEDENFVKKIDNLNKYIKLCGDSLGNIYRDEGDNREDHEIISDLRGSKKTSVTKYYLHRNKNRINICANLINHFNVNSIILVDTVEYCDIIYDVLKDKCPNKKINIIHGKIRKRDEIIESVKNDSTGSSVIIATYGTMSTGVSIKNLTHGYLLDWGKKDSRTRQVVGRLIRILQGKQMSRLFDFQDQLSNSVFYSHSIERTKTYKKQNLPIKKYDKKIRYI